MIPGPKSDSLSLKFKPKMSQAEVDILKRALAREKASRLAAEKILEDKSRELFESSKKIEQLLDERSSQLQGVFENIVDAYVVIDTTGHALKLNEAAIELFGYDIEKEDLNVKDLIYKDDYQYAMRSFEKLLTQSFFKDYEARVYTKHKGIRWVHINASLVKDKNGKPLAAQGIVRDITQQKGFAEKLIKSENRLSSLIANLDSGILLEDEDRKIVLTNKKFCDFFGIPVNPELIKGQDCSNAAEQSKGLFKDEEGFVNRINEILENKELVLRDEVTMKNGTILERDFIPIFRNNTYHGHLWSYRDISLQKKYRKSIEEQKLKYSSIIANMNLGLVEVDINDNILMVNQSFCEMSGYRQEELIGKKGGDVFLDKNQRKHLYNENNKRMQGQTNSYELKIKDKSGRQRIWLISGAPNKNLNGEVIGSIGIHLDITDFKALELQKENLLKKLEKSNDELKEYAHIVSHDLKSPLRSIDALVSWLEEDNKGILDEASLKNFELIKSILDKMENLISDVLEYSSLSGKDHQLTTVDTQELVEDIVDMLYTPDHISLKICSKLPKVKADKVKLQQVFQNLITNAIKYNDKEKGYIEIRASDEGSFYEFSVRDNGIGIDPKNHDNIFKIFHSINNTKDSTGIGLSLVKKIIDLHDGEIWVESNLDEGSIFYFTLKK